MASARGKPPSAAATSCATVAPRVGSVCPLKPRLRGLKTRAAFLAAAKGGRWAAKGVVVQAYRDEAVAGDIGVGFTASRKVGGAVQRNRAKRRLRASAAVALSLGGKPGWSYVFIARGATLTRNWPSLLADATTGVLRAPEKQRR